MSVFQFLLHYFFHFIFPAFIAYYFFNKQWKKIYLVFLLTMIVDLDLLLAVPIFQNCRCSINFHPLHSYIACSIYILQLFHRRTRIIAIGLLMHMITNS